MIYRIKYFFQLKLTTPFRSNGKWLRKMSSNQAVLIDEKGEAILGSKSGPARMQYTYFEANDWVGVEVKKVNLEKS